MTSLAPYPIGWLILYGKGSRSNAVLGGAPKPEQMGSKEKFWTKTQDGRRWLVKLPRVNQGHPNGEAWAEKVGAEVAALLRIPHATVELGLYQERLVSLSESFLATGDSMIHGNELLFFADSSYPIAGRHYHRTHEHTIESIRQALARCRAPAGFASAEVGAFGLFTGYLLLDALIGNTDRHHENWAVVIRQPERLELAPSYDHASSLGRELGDSRRQHLLTTTDTNGDLRTYCRRATSALFAAGRTDKALTCFEAFERACDLEPGAAEYWKMAIRQVSPEDLHEIADRLPGEVISEAARTFVKKVLRLRLETLQELVK